MQLYSICCLSAAVVYLERVNEMQRKELRRKGVKKCYSYKEFVSEIKKIPKDKEVSIEDKYVYVDGICSIIFATSTKVAERNEKYQCKMHSLKIRNSVWELIKKYSEHAGCNYTEVIEYAIEELERRGGMKSAAEILGLDK